MQKCAGPKAGKKLSLIPVFYFLKHGGPEFFFFFFSMKKCLFKLVIFNIKMDGFFEQFHQSHPKDFNF